jgi:hypothetical protein
MQNIAMIAPADQVDRYITAADSFRMPYWDWARGKAGGGVPEFFTEPFVTVANLNGTTEEIRNPLYAYGFRPLIPRDFAGKVRSPLTLLTKLIVRDSGPQRIQRCDGQRPKIHGRSREMTISYLTSWTFNARTKMAWRWPSAKVA